MNVGTIDIDAIVRELTNVRSTDTTTVFLFGRQKWQGPTKHKPAAIWELWQPYAAKPMNTEALFIKDEIKTTRDGESPDFLLEVPLTHVKLLGLDNFVLTDDQVAKIRERIRQQRTF
jgi:hypothetical protein